MATICTVHAMDHYPANPAAANFAGDSDATLAGTVRQQPSDGCASVRKVQDDNNRAMRGRGPPNAADKRTRLRRAGGTVRARLTRRRWARALPAPRRARRVTTAGVTAVHGPCHQPGASSFRFISLLGGPGHSGEPLSGGFRTAAWQLLSSASYLVVCWRSGFGRETLPGGLRTAAGQSL